MKDCFFLLFFLSFGLQNICAQSTVDYSILSNWAAHPALKDSADAYPKGYKVTYSDTALADVFFIHPTTYTGLKIHNAMNAPIDNKDINNNTDSRSIYYQASSLNQAGRVFAPRYKQAHISAYLMLDTEKQEKVFDVAYQDVKAAFEYYLKNENHGKPIIIASHSQGTNHAERLLHEFFDNSPLQKQLVVAYLIGMPIKKNTYKNIPACDNPDQTQCFCSWRTYKHGTLLAVKNTDDLIVTNPLDWRLHNQTVSKEKNEGGILKDFHEVLPNLCDATVHKGILWIHKPKFKGSWLVQYNNYHVADYNLFYMNIKSNAHNRLMHFLKTKL